MRSRAPILIPANKGTASTHAIEECRKAAERQARRMRREQWYSFIQNFGEPKLTRYTAQ